MFVFFISCVSTNRIYNANIIDLSEQNKMHFVDITLNGIKTQLLIDTGASKSLLDITKSEEYGFKCVLVSEDQYVGLGGLQDIYITYQYKVDEFYISFLGADLSEIQEYFIKDGIRIVGILGSDYLENNKATIDFKENKLYLRP